MFTRLTLAALGLLSLLLAAPAFARVSAVTLQADLPQPQPIGTSITLTASATADSAVQYWFRVGIKSGASYGWTTLQAYSANATCQWTPATPAGYSLIVYARSAGSTTYEKFATLGFVVSPPPLTGLTVEMNPRPVQTAGQPVELSATAVGGKEVQFRFKVGMKSGNTYTWGLLRDYAPAPACAWTPLVPGAYHVEITALDRGSAASAYVRVPYRVLTPPVPPAPTIAGFTPMSGPAGTTVTLTGTGFTGATAVTLSGRTMPFTVTNATTLTAVVPDGATTGPIAVTTAGGTATSATDFTVTGFTPPNGHEMVWVPGGIFTMGTEYDAWWQQPQTQQVTLSGYWLDKYEVTVAQYRAFCAATGRALPTWPGTASSRAVESGGADPALPTRPGTASSRAVASGWADPALQPHPIVNVTWHDAQAYADWAGLRLPTEAQWEYAARGAQGRNYPWGGTATAGAPFHGWDAAKCANGSNSLNVGRSTWPVGSFPAGASWCGAHDLAGNVWEWCADWFGPYANTPVTNPQGPASGDYRVLRGGAWSGSAGSIRGANRFYGDLVTPFHDYGFRCVSLAPGP